MTDSDEVRTTEEIDPAELEGLARVMTPFEPTVDQCRDSLIYHSFLGEMERMGRDVSALSMGSEEFLHVKKRMRKDKADWKSLRNSGREILRKIRKLNAMSIPDIFKALESRDKEVKEAISLRLVLRNLFGTPMPTASLREEDPDQAGNADNE